MKHFFALLLSVLIVLSLLTALPAHPVTADTAIRAAIAITILLFFIIKYLLNPCS